MADLFVAVRAHLGGRNRLNRCSLAANVKLYFCDPQYPWQRGSNETANGPA